jgi:hypothetical protein
MQVRKTRRGKTIRLGVEKISPQEGKAGAPAVGCNRREWEVAHVYGEKK